MPDQKYRMRHHHWMWKRMAARCIWSVPSSLHMTLKMGGTERDRWIQSCRKKRKVWSHGFERAWRVAQQHLLPMIPGSLNVVSTCFKKRKLYSILMFRANASTPMAFASLISCSIWSSLIPPTYVLLEEYISMLIQNIPYNGKTWFILAMFPINEWTKNWDIHWLSRGSSNWSWCGRGRRCGRRRGDQGRKGCWWDWSWSRGWSRCYYETSQGLIHKHIVHTKFRDCGSACLGCGNYLRMKKFPQGLQ